jgi:UV DNA damage endonuclease
MRLRHLGYVGQNLTLGLTTGRTLRLANVPNEERLAEVIGANLAALEAILAWNVRHGIGFFRIASSFIPFASHPDFVLDWRERFAAPLERIEAFTAAHALRLSMHPGQYTVLNAMKPQVVASALAELEYHAQLLDALAGEAGTITLHVGGAYGDRDAAKARAAVAATRLSERALARLTFEHDDTLFDLDDALEVAGAVGVPVVFDIHHHRCLHRRASWQRDLPALLERVMASWGERVPKVHVSSARSPGEKAHADFVDDLDLDLAIDVLDGVDGGRPVDVMLEAKAKEAAVLRHRARLGRLGGAVARSVRER